jgi:hypothetical protein
MSLTNGDRRGETLLNMFGNEQLTYFKGWLKIASYECLANDIKRPGQVLVLKICSDMM